MTRVRAISSGNRRISDEYVADEHVQHVSTPNDEIHLQKRAE